MKKTTLIDLLTSLLSGIGIIFTLCPLFLWWFIGGDYERYRWIIKGPFPFSYFGSGAFQILASILLFALGILLIIISIILRKKFFHSQYYGNKISQ